MRAQPKIGLLPLYLALYDEINPDARHAYQSLLDDVAQRFQREKVQVIRGDICRLDAEFREAVDHFEAEGVDAIVTLHLAYSPSEEATGALCATDLPIVMLDTTMDEAFGPEVDPSRIMYNHGIHGVMDLAAMLRRWRRPFHVVAGHLYTSPVVSRAADLVRASVAASEFIGSRVMRLGFPFRGMGDFSVEPEVLAQAFGIDFLSAPVEGFAGFVQEVTDVDLQEEYERDCDLFQIDCPEDVHRRSLRVGLGLRRFLREHDIDGFSMNFQAFTSTDPPIDTVPFLEASKAMSHGIGYAGEGDVLTAALVGALCRSFPMTTFTEIFCPDWAGNTLLLSHMGEINPEVIPGKPLLLEKDYPFSPTNNPAFVTGSPGQGEAVFVNLSPGPDHSFRLILSPVEIMPDTDRPEWNPIVRGWMRPATLPVNEFLEAYSQAGGTHHSALVLGPRTAALEAMAEYLDLECVVIP